MSTSGSEAEDNLPSAAECEQRCQRFAEVTGTDTALAMFFLQDRQWNLDQSLNAFFEENGGSTGGAADTELSGSPSTLHKPAVSASSNHASTAREEEQDKVDGQGQGQGQGKGDSKVKDPEPHRIRVLSWNIDGLSQAYLNQRTTAVINTIKREKAEVVLLQEVVGKSEEMLREGLRADYRVLPAGTASKEGYYTAVLLHKSRAMLDDVDVTPFLSSMMGRSLQTITCCVKGVPMTVMTSHLESTGAHASERKRQLKAAFTRMKESPSDHTVIFGGDLNLRDKELAEVGGLPPGVVDAWEATGSRGEARYTWDTFRNDNLGSEGRWRSKHRFDRLYMRHRTGSTAAVKPIYFELVGLERLEGTRCFPSDHWGILTHLDILPSFDK